MGRPQRIVEVRDYLEFACATLEFLRREYRIPEGDPILNGIPEDAVFALLNRGSKDPKEYLKATVRNLLWAKLRRSGP